MLQNHNTLLIMSLNCRIIQIVFLMSNTFIFLFNLYENEYILLLCTISQAAPHTNIYENNSK